MWSRNRQRGIWNRHVWSRRNHSYHQGIPHFSHWQWVARYCHVGCRCSRSSFAVIGGHGTAVLRLRQNSNHSDSQTVWSTSKYSTYIWAPVFEMVTNTSVHFHNIETEKTVPKVWTTSCKQIIETAFSREAPRCFINNEAGSQVYFSNMEVVSIWAPRLKQLKVFSRDNKGFNHFT